MALEGLTRLLLRAAAASSPAPRAAGGGAPPPLPRTNRTSLVPPFVLSGQVSAAGPARSAPSAAVSLAFPRGLAPPPPGLGPAVPAAPAESPTAPAAPAAEDENGSNDDRPLARFPEGSSLDGRSEVCPPPPSL